MGIAAGVCRQRTWWPPECIPHHDDAVWLGGIRRRLAAGPSVACVACVCGGEFVWPMQGVEPCWSSRRRAFQRFRFVGIGDLVVVLPARPSGFTGV